MLDKSFRIPPSLAIAEGASAPNPGGAAASGAVVWSTTLGSLVRWSGTAWNAVGGGGGSGLTFPQVRAAQQRRI